MVLLKETGKPKSFAQGQSFCWWAAQFCSLSLSCFVFPPVQGQFWEGRWCVLSPAPKEVSEFLGHKTKTCATPPPLCFVPKEKLRLLGELKHGKT